MKKTFQVKGMHCNSCAQVIENELKDKVNKVSVSFSKEKAEIDFDESKISEDEIKKIIKKHGYELQEKEKKKIDSNSIGWIFLGIAGIILFILAYYAFSSYVKLPEIPIPQFGEKTSLILLFVAGLLTGFHCVSMCGGFVVSYTAKNAVNGHKGYKQHFIYGFSKVISYAIIGGIFGLIGGFIAFSTGLRGAIAILAGLFMIFYALSIFGLRFFKKFQFNPKFLSRFSAKTSSKAKGPYIGPFVTGLLNGLFIACGPLQAMYLYAAGTGSVLTGAMSLAVFGLGTMPVMIGFGSFASVISHSTTKKILKISGIIVLILGLIMLNRGLSLVGSDLNFNSITSKISGNSLNGGNSAGSVVVSNGVQEINMKVDASGYSPSSFVLKKGVPVKWNVNVVQLTSCNSELVLNAYGIDKKLQSGMNVIEFTPDKDGTIPFTCGMGMLHGSFVVTDTGTASTQQVSAASTASASSASGGSCNMGANSGSGGGGCGCGMKM